MFRVVLGEDGFWVVDSGGRIVAGVFYARFQAEAKARELAAAQS